MPAKPKGDKGPRFKPGQIEVTVQLPDMKIITAMFERVKSRILNLFLQWLESEEGQEAIRQAIREELKR